MKKKHTDKEPNLEVFEKIGDALWVAFAIFAAFFICFA